MKDKQLLSWEQTIELARTKTELSTIIYDSYLEENLILNIERFFSSVEFKETIKLIESYSTEEKPSILDIGSGNGISAIAFSLKGYRVTALEPDPSSSVGNGAIKFLKNHYNLSDLQVIEAYAESMPFEESSFDVVYARQSMHHANSLDLFLKETSRVLKKGGILLTVRDHVIKNDIDKEVFLKHHPLHKYYGGENAFTARDYKTKMISSGYELLKEFKFFDTVINYYPLDPSSFNALIIKINNDRFIYFNNKIRNKVISYLLFPFYNFYLKLKLGSIMSEKNYPGRMYSYVCRKK